MANLKKQFESLKDKFSHKKSSKKSTKKPKRIIKKDDQKNKGKGDTIKEILMSPLFLIIMSIVVLLAIVTIAVGYFVPFTREYYVENTVNHGIKYVDDKNMELNTTKTKSNGKDGVMVSKMRETYFLFSGTSSEPEIIDELITIEPVDEVVLRGTKKPQMDNWTPSQFSSAQYSGMSNAEKQAFSSQMLDYSQDAQRFKCYNGYVSDWIVYVDAESISISECLNRGGVVNIQYATLVVTYTWTGSKHVSNETIKPRYTSTMNLHTVSNPQGRMCYPDLDSSRAFSCNRRY